MPPPSMYSHHSSSSLFSATPRRVSSSDYDEEQQYGSDHGASSAFEALHSEHIHNSRQAVFSNTSSPTSSPRPASTAHGHRSFNPFRSSARSSVVESSPSSSVLNLFPHQIPEDAAMGEDIPDYSPFGGYPVTLFPLFIEEKEDDDYLHNPDMIDSSMRKWYELDRRGAGGLFSFTFMVAGAIAVFILLPVLTFTGHVSTGSGKTVTYVESALTDYSYDTLKAVRTSMIDPDTPEDVYEIKNRYNETLKLVFSDEFNKDGRTFYPNDDQFWEAGNFHYEATQDLEWYDPDAVSTINGTLVLKMDAFKNHDLDYRSGMLMSWNKLCFKGGAIEASVSLGGPGDKVGLWPAVWTIGNLGRPGYLATTDGTWPYSYNSCDVGITPNQSSSDGISWLTGQRLSSCTCSGEDHPNQGTGRSAPEIDVIEGSVASYNSTNKVGVASQSFQIAPMDPWYYADYGYLEVYNSSVTTLNTWKGGTSQMAVSAVTALNTNWYQGVEYQSYGYEYEPGTDGYIQWKVGDTATFAMDAAALRPNGNIAQRPIPEEPMSIVLNFAISDNWAYIDWQEFHFPLFMYVDYVRIYQKEGNETLTCDPEGYPTTDYISDHPKAYLDYNVTTWYVYRADRQRQS
ncbi:beta-glucanase, GH16 family [Limtongia smithiae]|uniref:beta-glucanase, GH16 family n=1 Tax=Limtongia smithiae TaxID=1125753 RepID=UPI0034CD6538